MFSSSNPIDAINRTNVLTVLSTLLETAVERIAGRRRQT